jgi:hypothetical protein
MTTTPAYSDYEQKILRQWQTYDWCGGFVRYPVPGMRRSTVCSPMTRPEALQLRLAL